VVEYWHYHPKVKGSCLGTPVTCGENRGNVSLKKYAHFNDLISITVIAKDTFKKFFFNIVLLVSRRGLDLNHRYQKSSNRLLKVCYVPATSAGLPRSLFWLQPLTVLMKQTRQAEHSVKQSILLICL
jgi:hypothetical protein